MTDEKIKTESEHTHSTNTPDVSTSPKSPVVEKSFHIMNGVGLILALIVLVSWFSYLHFSGKKTEEPSKPLNTSSSNDQLIKPPTLPLSNDQIQRLKEAVSTINLPPSNQESEHAEAVKAIEIRLSSPSLVSTSGEDGATNTASENNGNSENSSQGSDSKNNAVIGGDGTGDSNTQFMAKLSASDPPTVEATQIAHPSTTLTQGNIIQASLLPAVDSDLPGMLTAVVSSDVYSDDDNTLLIPRGSQLVGQYTNAIVQGQDRIFVVWQRLKRSDGITIQLNSPGTDAMGTAGFAADSIDHHLAQEFGIPILLSMIAAGSANVGVNPSDQYNSASAYRQALSTSFNQQAQQNLQNTGVIPPTLFKYQGAKVSVYIARDLDFYNALNGITESNNTGSLFQGVLN